MGPQLSKQQVVPDLTRGPAEAPSLRDSALSMPEIGKTARSLLMGERREISPTAHTTNSLEPPTFKSAVFAERPHIPTGDTAMMPPHFEAPQMRSDAPSPSLNTGPSSEVPRMRDAAIRPPERARDTISLLPGVDIPTREAIMTQPIEHLRASLGKAFSALCDHIEPLVPYLKPIAFHGTSVEGANAFLGGAAPRDSRLWVGAVDRIPPTTALLVRDLLNAAQTGAGFSGPGAGTKDGALLVIRRDEHDITPCPLVDAINHDDGYLRLYIGGEERRGGLALRKDIGGSVSQPGQLKDAIAEVIRWADSPYADISVDDPTQGGPRRSVLREARAFFAIAQFVGNFDNSPFRANSPIERSGINKLKEPYESLPDGRLIDREKSSFITIIDHDRVVFVPRDPEKLGRFIGETFPSVTEEAFTLLREALPTERIPAETLVAAVKKWQSLPEYQGMGLRQIAEAFVRQYAGHLDARAESHMGPSLS
jgi:hypothetical protein